MDVVDYDRLTDRLARSGAPPRASTITRLWPNLPTITFTCAAAVAGVLALTLMAYALPAEMDWGRILREGGGHHDLGWFSYTFGYTYFHWQGRWASCALESLVLPYIDPVPAYPLLLAGIAGVDLLGLFVVVKAFLQGTSRGTALVVTLGAATLLWAGMPSIAEGVYWSLGAIENVMVLSLAGMLLVAIATVDPRRFSRRSDATLHATLAAVTITICGFHELYGSMLWLALSTGCVAAAASKSGRTRLWATMWAAASVGLAIVLLAPGNAHRLDVEAHPHSRESVQALRLVAKYLWSDARLWLLDPKLIAASLWVAASPTLYAARALWPTAKKVPWQWVFPGLGVALLLVGFFLPSYAFGNAIPGRTLSGVYVVFVACWLLTVYTWTRQLDRPADERGDLTVPSRARQAVAAAALLLLSGSVLLTGNVPMAARDLLVRVRPWHAASVERYATVRQASQSGKVVLVPSLPPKPWSLLAGEISDDPHDWHNIAIADYFHLRSVKRVPLAGSAQASLPSDIDGR